MKSDKEIISCSGSEGRDVPVVKRLCFSMGHKTAHRPKPDRLSEARPQARPCMQINEYCSQANNNQTDSQELNQKLDHACIHL